MFIVTSVNKILKCITSEVQLMTDVDMDYHVHLMAEEVCRARHLRRGVKGRRDRGFEETRQGEHIRHGVLRTARRAQVRREVEF